MGKRQGFNCLSCVADLGFLVTVGSGKHPLGVGEGNEGVPLTICNALTNLTNELLHFKHLHRPRNFFCKCVMNAQMEEESK